MSGDLNLVVGVILAVLAVVFFITANRPRRRPRALSARAPRRGTGLLALAAAAAPALLDPSPLLAEEALLTQPAALASPAEEAVPGAATLAEAEARLAEVEAILSDMAVGGLAPPGHDYRSLLLLKIELEATIAACLAAGA
jgi:hypothetical protein